MEVRQYSYSIVRCWNKKSGSTYAVLVDVLYYEHRPLTVLYHLILCNIIFDIEFPSTDSLSIRFAWNLIRDFNLWTHLLIIILIFVFILFPFVYAVCARGSNCFYLLVFLLSDREPTGGLRKRNDSNYRNYFHIYFIKKWFLCSF